MNKNLRQTICTLLLIPVTLTGCKMALPGDARADQNKESDADLVITAPANEESSDYEENDYARVPDN